MPTIQQFVHIVQNETLEVKVWQVLLILTVATLFLFARQSKMGLLVTYVFTLHVSFSFFKPYFSMPALFFIGIFSGLILLIGLFEALNDS